MAEISAAIAAKTAEPGDEAMVCLYTSAAFLM
jgi:hypothetical protein